MNADVAELGIDRGNASGRATRLLLMRTAEQLFAQRGIAAVSLREIGQRAGQRNTAATQYHFGSKERLIETIFSTRVEEVDRRRHELIDGLDRPLEEHGVETIVQIALQPHIETVTRKDHHFVGFVARLSSDHGMIQRIVEPEVFRPFHGGHLQLMAAARSVVAPDVDPDVFAERYNRMILWGVHTLAEIDIGEQRLDDDVLDELIGMLARALG